MMSAGSSTSCSCSCRGVAVFLLLCFAANAVSGKTDAASSADLYGIGILIQRNPPPRTVVRIPLPSTTSSKTSAHPASLPPPQAAEVYAAPATVTVAVPAGNGIAGIDAALPAAGAAGPTVPATAATAAGAAGSYTVTTTTTTVTTTTTGLAGKASDVALGSIVPATQPAVTTATVVATPALTPPAAAIKALATPAGMPTATTAAAAAPMQMTETIMPSHPVLKPAFSTIPAVSTQQLSTSSTAQQATPGTPATPAASASTASGMTSLQPLTSVPPAAGSSSSSSVMPPIPIPMAGPTVKAPPPFIYTQKDAKQMLLIGCSVPFEGSQQLAGQAVYSALKMAVTQLVPKELPGFNVNITCINSKCEDIPAHMAVSKFAAEGAIGVIGDICSRASVAAAGLANMRKIPVISPASTSPSLSETDFFFRTVPSDKFQGVTAANLVRKSGANTTAIVYEDSAYGYGLAFNFIAGFTKERGTVPVVYQFKAGKGDPKAAVAEVEAGVQGKGVQAVFMATNNLTFAADFLVEAKAANLSLPIFAGDALSDYMLYEQLAGRPSLINKVTSTSVSPGSKEFVRAFANFTGSDPSTSYQAYAAHAYDAVTALLRAYSTAAAPKDGPAIKAQINKLDFQGVGGRVRFDVYGDLVPDNQTYVAVKFNSTSGARAVQGFVSR